MSEFQESNPNKIALRMLFPTFANEAWYPLFVEEKPKLLERIYQIRQQDNLGREYSVKQFPNGYTSFYTLNRLYKDTVFDGLTRFLYEIATDFANQQFWDLENFELVMNQFWCNINSRYSYHRDHVHPYSQISGVFYVQAEKSSPSISFRDPRIARWMVPPPARESRPENTLFAAVPAEEGKVFMFPAWLDHGVPMNQTETDRISMSFNFELRHKGEPKP
jgi:uncharacterized protein (TIGR02466 family)